MKVLRVRLDIPPFGNLETRATKDGKMYTPQEKKVFMLAAARELRPYAFAFENVDFIHVSYLFVCDRPANCPEHIPTGLWKQNINLYRNSSPDVDNYIKPLQDSMTWHVIKCLRNKQGEVTKRKRGAQIIDDDKFIVSVRAKKIFRRLDQRPHVLITIQEISNPVFDYDDYASNFPRDKKSKLSSGEYIEASDTGSVSNLSQPTFTLGD